MDEVIYGDVSVVSNVLKIKNNNGKNYTFSVYVNVPTGWKCLLDENKEFVLKPNDSIYVPVRILTSNKKTKGGTKYNIAAYINTNEGKQMAYARFLAGRPKITNWQMHILPRPKIYFLNGENESNFQLNLVNDGDENQDVLVSFQKLSKDLILKDTLDRIIRRNYFELVLPPFSDTTISYNIQTFEDKRNERRIDVWGYHPFETHAGKRYGLYIKASEVSLMKNKVNPKGKKLDFLKLANSIDFVKLNSNTIAGNNSNSIPMSLFLNVSNLFGQQPVANFILFGNSAIGKNSTINYNLQSSFLYYVFNRNFYNSNISGNIIYTYKRYVFGLFSAGGLNGSKGLMFGTPLTKSSFITLTYNRQSITNSSTPSSLGAALFSSFKKVSMNLNTNILFNPVFNNPDYNINTFINIPLTKNYNQFYIYNINRVNNTLTSYNLRNMYGVGQVFSIKQTTINLFYTHNVNNTFIQNTSNASNYNNMLNLLVRSNFRKKITFIFTSTASSNLVQGNRFLFNGLNSSFLNTLTFQNFKPKNKRPYILVPGLFYNYTKILFGAVSSQGILINASKSNFENNLFLAAVIRSGYSKIHNPSSFNGIPALFFIQTNLLLRYKVWNILCSYNYGTNSVSEIFNLANSGFTTLYPQNFRANIGHQYQFKNKQFVLENNLTYNYLNTLKSNSFNLFTQLFFFSRNYTRVGINMNYNYMRSSRKNSFALLPVPQQINSNEEMKIVATNLFLGFNIKKDFAIPIPKRFRNNKFCDSKFVVFLDFNGNKKMDDNEVPVENVVLRMNDYEVITNENGSASFINISFAKYKFQVLPLIDMGSWFPNVGDSLEVCGPEPIYIPFSKGVEITGKVEISRENFTGEIYEKLDVSRFKIYMIDSAGRTFSSLTDLYGNFSFYVPYAKYTLKFDESVLGTNFYLPDNDIALDFTSGIESYYHHFLIVEKRRKVKKKIFGPDGKITYVEESASGKDKKDKTNAQNEDELNKKDSIANLNKDGKDGKDGAFNIQIKETKLDSLIKLLNDLLKRVATKPDVKAIVKQEIQLLRDELNATFTIQIEEFPKGKRPTGVLLQLIRMKKVEELKLPDGKVVYYSGDYKTVQEAEKFCKDFQSSGFKKAQVANRKTLLNSNK